MQDNTGDYYIGRYRVLGAINSGGFATVLRARDEGLQRDVAIKIPKVSSQTQLLSIKKEGQILAKLRHEHIVRVFDIGSTEKWPCFIVSEYIEGKDLRELSKTKKFSLREAVGLTSCIAKALYHAHQMGLVHRDVKPANILMGKDAHPFLADFGLALSEFESGSELAGTATYMSPEQASGGVVDHRSDIYSLSTVLFELLVGRTPFAASSQFEMIAKLSSQSLLPTIPASVKRWLPLELQRIILKGLAKRVDDRYPSAMEFAKELDDFVSSLRGDWDVKPIHDSRITEFWSQAKKLSSRQILILAGLVIGLCLVVTSWAIWNRPSKLFADAILETKSGEPILAFENLVEESNAVSLSESLKRTIKNIKPDAVLPSGTPVTIVQMPKGPMSTVERLLNGELKLEAFSQDLDRNTSAKVKVLTGEYVSKEFWIYAGHVRQVPTFEVSSRK